MNWKNASRSLALAAAGIGAVGFAGWVFGVDALKRIHPAWVTMKANTGLCLILAGLAVALLRDDGVAGFRRRVAHVCAVIIFAVGLLTFGEHPGWWDAGIDQALFQESLAEAGRSFPGRMGPASAVNFMLLGLAVLLLDTRSRRGPWPAQVCALGVFASTFLIFLAYFYNVELPERLALHLSIALHTVVAFLLLAAAVLLARPNRGITTVFLADDTGGIIARRLLPAALLLPALIGWLCILGREAGYYGRGASTALLATALTVILTSLVWWVARARATADKRRRSVEEELQRSERELSDFFDNAALALHWVGPDGLVLRANDAELAALGYSREEYVGHHIADFHADPEVIEDILARLTAGETLMDYPARLRRKDGSVLEVLIHSSVYRQNGRFIHTRCFTRDVTALKQAEAARNRLAAIVDSSADAILSKTLDGIVTSWNAGAQRLFGYVPDEIIGQPVTRIIPPDRQSEEIEILRRLSEGEDIEHYETIRVAKDGRVLVSLSISPVRDEAGVIVGASTIVRDITARKETEAALAKAHAEAEAANRAKDDFLAVLSHELRTPLTPALMAVSDLEAAPPSDTAALREALAMIRRNIELEARLVDDLLDLTRISRGKLRIASIPVGLHATLGDALAIAEPMFREKRIAVASELTAQRHLVRGDAARLAQVFSNVLTNAAKFTPEAGRVTIRTVNTGDGAVRIEVTDSGIGIAPEALPKVFEAFQQEESSITRRFGGLGLGLSVAKSLVEAHGGTIEARSEGRDRGATFAVTLPTLSDTDVAVVSSAAPPPSQPGRLLRVLLVEDHEDTRHILERLIARAGHRVTSAGSVAEGRQTLANEHFDLLLTDLGLPDGTGLDVIAALRERSDIPAVAMSGYGMNADLARTREAGFLEHIVKPVSVDVLHNLLARLSAPQPSATKRET